MVLFSIDNLFGTYNGTMEIGLFSGLYSLAVLIPELAVSVRRLHDIGKSGWWIFIGLVPGIGFLALLYFMVQDSSPGDNARSESQGEACQRAYYLILEPTN